MKIPNTMNLKVMIGGGVVCSSSHTEKWWEVYLHTHSPRRRAYRARSLKIGNIKTYQRVATLAADEYHNIEHIEAQDIIVEGVKSRPELIISMKYWGLTTTV